MKPKIEGIRAVGDDNSINPHKPIKISTTEFIKLALGTLIFLSFNFIKLYTKLFLLVNKFLIN